MTTPEPATPDTPAAPTFTRWMGSMWLYTGLRIALFLVLWGVLLLIGLSALFAALLALVLSVPLSFVLLARPRERLAADIQARTAAARARRAHLDAELDPEADERE
jgi:O-antigen ligase